MKHPLLLLSILFLCFASCKKDKNDSCTLSVASLAGTYKITGATYQASATSAETNVFDQYFDDCEKDDLTILNANNTYTNTDAGLACDPEGSYSGNWVLNGTNFIFLFNRKVAFSLLKQKRGAIA